MINIQIYTILTNWRNLQPCKHTHTHIFFFNFFFLHTELHYRYHKLPPLPGNNAVFFSKCTELWHFITLKFRTFQWAQTPSLNWCAAPPYPHCPRLDNHWSGLSTFRAYLASFGSILYNRTLGLFWSYPFLAHW